MMKPHFAALCAPRYVSPLAAPAAALGVNEQELKAVLLRLNWIERGAFPIQATRAATLSGYARQQNGVTPYGKTYTRIHITVQGLAELKRYLAGKFNHFIHK